MRSAFDSTHERWRFCHGLSVNISSTSIVPRPKWRIFVELDIAPFTQYTANDASTASSIFT